MSQLSQNLEKIIQMISIEQLLGLVKQNTDNKSNSDIMNLPIVQKVVKAYEDEIQTLHTPSSCEKDYSGDIAKINEQLASINNNLLQLTEAIRNINISTKEVKREEEVDKNVVVVVEEEHVRLKIEEKQEVIEEEVISKAESIVASSNVVEEEEEEAVEEEEEEEAVEEEASETEEEVEETEDISETVEAEVASLEEEAASLEEEAEDISEESEKEISDEESVAEDEALSVAAEEEEEVFEIEIDDVTYYATSEENGILYEVDADGEVGKKVGIIKDGEPIFI